jgi:hypothetical protein
MFEFRRVIGFFNWPNPSSRTTALTEMWPGIFLRVKRGRRLRLTTSPLCLLSKTCGSLDSPLEGPFSSICCRTEFEVVWEQNTARDKYLDNSEREQEEDRGQRTWISRITGVIKCRTAIRDGHAASREDKNYILSYFKLIFRSPCRFARRSLRRQA